VSIFHENGKGGRRECCGNVHDHDHVLHDYVHGCYDWDCDCVRPLGGDFGLFEWGSLVRCTFVSLVGFVLKSCHGDHGVRKGLYGRNERMEVGEKLHVSGGGAQDDWIVIWVVTVTYEERKVLKNAL